VSRRHNKKRSRRARQEAAALSPAVPLPQPGGGPSHGLRLFVTRQAGVRVTEGTALTLGAVWACRRVIGEDLAKLPWGVFKKTGTGRTAQPEHPVEWLLHTQANPECDALAWRDTILGHALLWGNGFSEIERDAAGRPHWLWLLTPDRVEPARTAGGRLVYDVANAREPNTVLDAADVFHLRGPGFDSLVGYSMVRFAARCIGLGISLEEEAANFNANDSTPGGVLESPRRLTDNAAKNLRESWQGKHGGPHKRRTVAILEEGVTWKQTGLPPEDSQLIQSRQATPAEICRWFRVPPHKIADLLRATFSNIEDQEISYVGDALVPWARRLETEADLKLFGPINRGTLFTRLNFHQQLRGNSAARVAYYMPLLDRGVFCLNEVRDMEGLNPIGPDGDKRFVALNMQLLEDAGEEPPAPPAPKAPPPAVPGEAPPGAAKPAPPAPKPPAKAMSAALLPVLEDACARVLRREATRVGDANKRLEGAKLTAWRDEFRESQLTFLREALTPGLHAVAAVEDADPVTIFSVVLPVFAASYAADLDAHWDAGAHPAGLAGHYAARLLRGVQISALFPKGAG
jgi:HK97 family phage portal protein